MQADRALQKDAGYFLFQVEGCSSKIKTAAIIEDKRRAPVGILKTELYIPAAFAHIPLQTGNSRIVTGIETGKIKFAIGLYIPFLITGAVAVFGMPVDIVKVEGSLQVL